MIHAVNERIDQIIQLLYPEGAFRDLPSVRIELPLGRFLQAQADRNVQRGRPSAFPPQRVRGSAPWGVGLGSNILKGPSGGFFRLVESTRDLFGPFARSPGPLRFALCRFPGAT